MGKFVMEVWYQSPYPDDAARIPKLYLCEFCLRYQKSEVGMKRHAAKCVWRHPPGDEVRRYDVTISRSSFFTDSDSLLRRFIEKIS
jgi:histone acetyltransferase MYST2